MKNLMSWPLPGIVGTLGLLASPLIVSDPYWRHVFCVVAFSALAAVGLNIVAGYADQISLGHGAFALIGAYSSALVTTRLDLPIVIGVLSGAVLAGVLGFVLGALCLRLSGMYLALVTAAAAFIVLAVVQQTEALGGENGLLGIPGFVDFESNVPIAMVVFGSAIAGCSWLLYGINRSHVGRALAAVRTDQLLASSIGINTRRAKLGAFTCSAIVTSFAGSFYAHWQGSINPQIFDLTFSLTLLLYVFFGGSALIAGPVVGAIGLSALPEVAPLDLLSWVPFIYGAALLLVVAYVPRGLVGTLYEVKRTLLARRVRPADAVPSEPDGRVSTQALVMDVEGTALKLDHVTKKFGGLVAVNEAAFVVEPGTVHCLIGPNGSGKSTTIDLISGVLELDSGQISIGDTSLDNVDLSRRIGSGVVRTFQGGRLLPEASVLDNVMLGAHHRFTASTAMAAIRSRGSRAEERALRNEAVDLLNAIQLGDYIDRPARSLSAGHQRMLEIARAAMARPKVMLLDEPAAGLASFEIDLLLQCIAHFRDAGIAVLLVEHHLEMVMSLADTITVLDGGRIIAAGDPESVRRSPAVIAAYLGADYVEHQPILRSAD